MSNEDVPTYEYTESEFIYRTAPWVDRTAAQHSKFDIELQKRWDKAMKAGAFRYGIDHIVTRILPGPKRYVGQLNTLRATERRKPQEISSVDQPFNPEAFNFTKVQPEEIIFDLRNLSSDQTLSGNRLEEGNKPVCNGAAVNGVETQDSNGTTAKHSSTADSESPALASESKQSGADTPQANCHRLVINVSPMENGHCLLVPEICSGKPQVLTQVAIEVAIETMLLSRHRGFRMGYNSLCAFASVNHLHFHVYYLEYELIMDYCPVRHLAGRFYEVTAVPCPGFAIQLHGSTVQEMARLGHKISSYFHKADIAHNMFMCRGTVFGEERSSPLTTIRLFLWPRKKFIGKKSSVEFNVACIELGGHLPIREELGYHNLTEADVDAILEEACLPQEEYEEIREAVVQMGLEEASRASVRP